MGNSKDTLITTYKSYILPVLTFGNELLICASKSSRKKLEIVQNKALRIITGGTKSTPIEAMQMFTNIKPIEFLCEENALKMFERIRRVPNSLWNNFNPAENRLPSKVSFLHKVQSTYHKYGLEFATKIRRFTSRKKKRPNIRKFKMSKHIITRKFQEEIVNHHKNISMDKSWENLQTTSIKSIDRKVYVANFRKMTGHDLLYKHLHRIGVVPSPTCILCHSDQQTSDHLLVCRNQELEHFRGNIPQSNNEETFSQIYWFVRDRQ